MTDAGQPPRLPDAESPQEQSPVLMDPRLDLLCRELDMEVASSTLFTIMDALQRLYFQVPSLSLQEMRDQLAHIDCLLQQALFPTGPDVG
jgi:hypothetical protein